MPSISDIINFIKLEEVTLNLFALKCDDEYIWPLLRFKLSQRIQMELGIIKEAHDKQAIETRVERYKKAFRNELLVKVYHKKHDTIIIPHFRRVEEDGKDIDIYTYKIQADYPNALILNRNEFNNLKHKNSGLIYLEESVIDKYNKKMQKKINTYERQYPFNLLSEAIKEQFDIHIDVNEMFRNEWIHFVRRKVRFDILLKKIKPKQVILVVGYDKYDIICACKRSNVKVIEVQHGIIDKNHLGYDFDLAIPSNCFVDELWLFAPYWKMNTHLPISADKIKYITFAYFHDQMSKVEMPKTKKAITFISQGTTGERLVKEALLLANVHPELKIIYKLHPGEFENYQTRYPSLLALPSNFKVVSNEISLYALLKASKYIIGAYSTAIYEGLALGCIGILLDVPGTRDYMSTLIDNDLVYISDNIVQDFDYIKNDSKNKEVINIYF